MPTTKPPTYFGSLSEFQPGSESVKSYIERVKIFFKANHIPEDDQAVILLSYVGAKAFEVLRDLLAPTPPSDCNLEKLVKTLEDHYEPKPNVIAERYVFHRRNQLPNESVTDYTAELRRLAARCDFGTVEGVTVAAADIRTGLLNDTLRDRLVLGIRSEAIQKALLSKKTLTFQEACELALSMEAAARSSKAMQQSNGIQRVRNQAPPCSTNKSPQESDSKPLNPPRPPGKPCYRCGRTNHIAPNCRFIYATCNKCGKKGHIAPVCKSATRKRGGSHTNTVKNQEQSPSSDTEGEEEVCVHVLGQKKPKLINSSSWMRHPRNSLLSPLTRDCISISVCPLE